MPMHNGQLLKIHDLDSGKQMSQMLLQLLHIGAVEIMHLLTRTMIRMSILLRLPDLIDLHLGPVVHLDTHPERAVVLVHKLG